MSQKPPFPPGAGLAPMAGVTDMAFRLLAHEQGASWAVSEMLSAKGFLYAPKDARAVAELLARAPGEGVVGLQIFGHEPELMAEAANQLSDFGFDFIDINMGCPAHKIVGNGDGSALMKDPVLAGRVVAAVSKASRLPVTVKIRAGFCAAEKNAPEIAAICEDAGARAITVHPRTRDQFYEGHSDWSVIRAVCERVRVPVVGNGDLRSGADALRMIEQTGCHAVSVGRAAQGNPWIFREIEAALLGAPYEKPTFRARAEMAMRHLRMEIAMRGERSAVLMMRKQLAWYLSGSRGSAALRAQINQTETADALFTLFARAVDEDETPCC